MAQPVPVCDAFVQQLQAERVLRLLDDVPAPAFAYDFDLACHDRKSPRHPGRQQQENKVCGNGL